MSELRYPKIFLRSKNELAKRLSHKNLSQKEALDLINDCIKNKDRYWSDHIEKSEPEKGKYVRDATGTKLAILLKLIDRKILKVHDHLLPDYIFGGVQKKDHVKAAKNLLGSKKLRTFMTIDLTKFYEQISQKRIESFFVTKTQCTRDVAKILSYLCCTPFGKKGSDGEMVLARGFSTSSRLAIWAGLNLFNKVQEISYGILKQHDPRISFYIDDIGISASKISQGKMLLLRNEIEDVFLHFDGNLQLKIHPFNSKKEKDIMNHSDSPEFLGIRLLRNCLTPGKKAYAKRRRTKDRMNKMSEKDRISAHNSYIGSQRYKNYVESK